MWTYFQKEGQQGWWGETLIIPHHDNVPFSHDAAAMNKEMASQVEWELSHWEMTNKGDWLEPPDYGQDAYNENLNNVLKFPEHHPSWLKACMVYHSPQHRRMIMAMGTLWQLSKSEPPAPNRRHGAMPVYWKKVATKNLWQRLLYPDEWPQDVRDWIQHKNKNLRQ